MKLKSTWFLFIPALLAIIGIQLYQSFYNPTFAGASLAVLIIAAVMFVGLIIMVCLDKYTVRDYPPKKNVISGAFLGIAGVLTAGSGMNTVTSLIGAPLDMLELVLAIVSMLAAIIFILMGSNAFSGSFTVTAAPVITLIPTLFCAVSLMKKFTEYTTEAVASSEMYDIIYLIFMLIFFYYCASIYAGIPTKYAVKCCFVFGMPAIALAFAWCIKEFMPVFTGEISFGFFAYLPEFQALAICGFIFSLLSEISLKAEVTNYFDYDAQDFSEEEELFGIPGKREHKSIEHSYRSPFFPHKTEEINLKNTRIKPTADDKTTQLPGTIEDDKTTTEDDDGLVLSGSNNTADYSDVLIEHERKSAERRKEESTPVQEEEDLGWIDRLIKDIEDEQQQNANKE